MSVSSGQKTSNQQFDRQEMLRYGVLAEQMGFDLVFVSDHLQLSRHDGGQAPLAMTWLGALGAHTERVTIGTSVLKPTFRHHTVIVAQASATLDCPYPDRVVLGMDTCESINEVPLGLVWPEGKVRFALFREAVAQIRQPWSQEVVSYKGEYYQTMNATIYNRPDLPVPPFLAASGPAAARYAGRVDDGYITTSRKAPELYTDSLLPAVTEGPAKAGRTVADLDMMIEVKGSSDHVRDAAMQAARFWGGAGPDAGAEVRGGGSVEDAALGRRAAGRAHRDPVHRLHQTHCARPGDEAVARPGFHASGVPRAGTGLGALAASVRHRNSPATGDIVGMWLRCGDYDRAHR